MTGSPRILRPTLRLGSLAITLAATTLAAAAVTVPAASASTQESPWGPAKTLARGQLSPSLQQTTGRTGNTVLVFRTTPHGSPSQVQVVDQVDGTWSTPASVSTKKVFRPTVTAWGAGNIAVIWQSKAGVNSWRFHLRNLNPNGSWQPEQILTTARHAYPWYQAAITTKGRVALAWVDADNTDRVSVEQRDGTWVEAAPVPVVHPTYGTTPYIANPLALFLDDRGRVTDVTWGTLDGSRRAIWLMALDADGSWSSERVAPLDGTTLGYNWVHEANFAANPAGDIAIVAPQRDPETRRWATLFSFRPAGGTLQTPRLLSHLRCDYLQESCADVSLADDGTALIGWGAATADGDVVVRTMRYSSSDGTYSSPQTISEPLWAAPYQGVQVDGAGNGEGVVSFVGGDHKTEWSQFSRCTTAAGCEQALRRDSSPSWLTPWVTTAGPGEATVSWVSFSGHALLTRQLAGV